MNATSKVRGVPDDPFYEAVGPVRVRLEDSEADLVVRAELLADLFP